MTILELVQMLHEEAGLEGTQPQAVTSQSGMNLKLVNWIKRAYKKIYELRDDWAFRIGDFEITTVSGTSNYTYSDASLTDFDRFKFDPRPEELSGIKLYSSEADETHLVYIPWADFEKCYLYGSHRSMTGRPDVFTIKPDLSITLHPEPNSAFTLNGKYIKTITQLAANTNTPVFDGYHEVIVWTALMFYGASEGDDRAYQHGQNERSPLMRKLERKYMPRFSWGPPLA